MVLPSPDPDSVGLVVVEAALAEARRIGVDSSVVNDITSACGHEFGDRGESAAANRYDARLPRPDSQRHQSDVPVGWSIGIAQQSGESRSTRRSRGAFYTPVGLARGLVAVLIKAPPSGHGSQAMRVCDPMCGAGGFLLCGAERLLALGADVGEIGSSLVGFDVDPVAVLATRLSLGLWLAATGGDPFAPSVHVVDAIHGEGHPDVAGGFDVIAGNPPFLGQLRTRSARSAAQRSSLESPRGYADAAFVALERSLDWLQPGGRLALVQPQSLLAARDAARVREQIGTDAALVGMWIGDEGAFDASVQVCAPVIEKHGDHTAASPNRVGIYRGPNVERAGTVEFSSWPELLAEVQGVPPLHRERRPDDHLLTIASATADFRDWFYDVAERVTEAGQLDDPVPVVTSGLIDPMVSAWGHRPAKIGGRRWTAPAVSSRVVEIDLHADDRLVPKILIANQTRCIEAIVDGEGTLLATTPVITVTPLEPQNIWPAAAVVMSPAASVHVHRRVAGSGLSKGAVRLTAKLIGSLPLPTADLSAWNDAADVLKSASDEAGDIEEIREQLLVAALLMQRAYGLDDRGDIYEWWQRQLPALRR